MFCSKCGQENSDNAKFCSSCGNSLNTDSEKSAEQKAEEIKQKSKESASTLFYLLKPLLQAKILVPIIAIVFLVVFYPNMKSTYDKYQHEQQKLAKEKKETFRDAETGLMWQDRYYDVRKSWPNAVSYCKNLEYAGYVDWRLPEYNELLSIVDYNRNDPTIKKGFKNVASDYYWSSSENVNDSSDAWGVGFFSGDTNRYPKTNKYYVRCVRGRQ